MCGRYTLHANKKALAEAIALTLPEGYKPKYNIAPGRETLCIATRDMMQAEATMMHWGLRTPQNFHINVRIENADTNPRFRESWYAYRCMLPASGFYEWYQDGITKQPYYIYLPQHTLHYFAGLWFPSTSYESPPSFVILTTKANNSIRCIHERMPVILKQASQVSWLDGTLDTGDVQSLASKVILEKHTVSRCVNSVQNENSRLIEATAPLTDDQMMLF
ncbi:MAG: SOS response-associated peptidase [Verrucomicrobiota bacterium]|nr:SOS response-associated peptidase [Verrucomicrobiota bacterium]